MYRTSKTERQMLVMRNSRAFFFFLTLYIAFIAAEMLLYYVSGWSRKHSHV